MIPMIILAVLILAGLAAFVFSSSFRTFVSNELNALGLLLQAYWPTFMGWLGGIWATIRSIVGVYALVVGIVALAIFLLTILALIIGAPGFTGFIFLLSISLILLTWMPAGVITKIFGRGFIPKSLKTFVAWVTFIGFLGLVAPGFMSFKVVIGAALVAFIMLGVTAKINLLDKVIYPFVIVMIAVLAWQNFFPESYRSSVRYASSWGKRLEAAKDRQSIGNEAEAATTYAIVLKDVASLWELSPSLIKERLISLRAGDTVKIVDRRNEVKIYDGQGFVQIQLPRQNGSFFGGEKYWIEAEFVQAVSPREVVPERVVKKQQESPSVPVVTPTPTRPQMVLGKGTHVIQLNRGEVSEEIRILSHSYCISSNQKRLAKLIYPNGSSKNLWEVNSLPQNNVLHIESLVDDHTITINVL
jgi:hypothetical protein